MKKVLIIILFAIYSNSITAQINVLSWNIKMRPIVIFPFDQQIKRSKEIQLIIKDFDIVLLQEVFETKTYKYLDSSFNYVIYPSKNDKLTSNGLMLLSKYPILSYANIYFDDCCGTDCLASKGATLAKIDILGDKYIFINTHLQANEGEYNDEIRLSQLKQIKTLLNLNRTINTETVIIGDFNQTHSLNVFENVLELNNCNLIGYSWVWKGDKELLDYVFSNSQISEFSLVDFKLSDHLGVIIKIVTQRP